MPTQLRSGALKEAPKKKYVSAYRIFFEDKSKQLHGLSNVQLQQQVSDEWDRLDDKKLQYYDDLYEKHNAAFKEQLLAFYGASKNEIKKANEEIPEKPRRPLALPLTFQHEVYPKVLKEHPDSDHVELQRMCAEMYRDLSEKERSVYEKRYDEEVKIYKVELEKWNNKYKDKQEAFEKFMEDKYKRKQLGDTLDYQELVPSKRTKKMKETGKGSPKKEMQKPQETMKRNRK